MGKFQDLTGQKFNRLTAIKYLGKSYWLCKCDCGKLKKIRSDHLCGGIISCGCYAKEISIELARQIGYKNRKYKNLPYNDIQNKIKRIWKHMIGRCKNINGLYYKKGIKVCNEWKDFENFYNWVINRKDFDKNKNGYQCSLDRINNDGDYEPKNCRFITHFEQQRNKGDNIFITYNGKTLCAKDWSNVLNLKYQTVLYRYKKGYPLDIVFNKKRLNKKGGLI